MVSVDKIRPRRGWPGTIVTIKGSGFSPNRDDNLVSFGNEPALIITAEPETLVVLVNENAKGGKTVVDVSGASSATGGEFEILPYPAADDHLLAGPPRFFHGPQSGTPKTNVTDQGVLILFCASPGAPPTELRRTNEIATIERALLYWRESSFGSTTWKPSYSEWLTLPHDHGFYYWTNADIDRTRQSLLFVSARAMTFDGTTITNGSGNGWIPIGHPTPLSWAYNPGYAGDGSKTLCLRRSGNLLLAGTMNGTLIAYDVTNPLAAVELGRLGTGTFPIWDVDIMPTQSRAVIAAGQAGTNLIDIANPAAMTLVSGPLSAATGAFRTRVAVNGSDFFSNAGTVLRMDRLAPSGGLTRIVDTDIGGWITDLELAGNLLFVTTYGRGLQIFQISAAGAVLLSSWGPGRRIAAVKFSNGRAYLAAYGDGVIVVDCSNPAAPALLGEHKLPLPVYDLEVRNVEVIVAAGNSAVWSVDASDPAAMHILGDHLPSSFEPSLPEYQDALDLALNSNGQAKNRNRVAIDALNAFMAKTGTPLSALEADYEGFITVHDGQVRGWSTLSPDPAFRDGGDVIAFAASKGLITLPAGSLWTTYSHEMAHWLGMGDIYREELADGSVIQGTAQNWCLSGDDSRGTLLCGHWISDTFKWYRSDTTADSNVLNLTWSVTGQHDDVHEVAAHGVNQDNVPNRYHLIRLTASSGLSYFVEVRQKMPPGLTFDQNLPLDAGRNGCVLVTRVNERNSPSNTFERDVQLVGILAPGEEVVDPARNLIISVDREVQSDPLIYAVRVRWNQAIPGDPNGTFDLTITPWNTKTWESPDIWVDSPFNNNGPAPVYEFHEGSDTSRPILSGDRPRVKRNNTIFARIRNTGPQTVDEAWVACYITSPPGIGDNGNWQLLDTKKVTDIGGFGEKLVTFDWTPSIGKHSCISIAIQPKIGEINTENNRAQENIAVFDSGSASSHEPVVLEAEVRSPYVVMKKIDVLICGLPKGWHAVIDKEWVWLQQKGASAVRAVIYNDINSPSGRYEDIPRLAFPRVEGWTKRHDRYESIGGILAPVRAVKKVTFRLKLEAGGGSIYVGGSLLPAVPNVTIAVEFTHESGEQFLRHGVTGASGSFSTNATSIRRGKYSVQAFTCGGAGAVETESDILIAEVD